MGKEDGDQPCKYVPTRMSERDPYDVTSTFFSLFFWSFGPFNLCFWLFFFSLLFGSFGPMAPFWIRFFRIFSVFSVLLAPHGRVPMVVRLDQYDYLPLHLFATVFLPIFAPVAPLECIIPIIIVENSDRAHCHVDFIYSIHSMYFAFILSHL